MSDDTSDGWAQTFIGCPVCNEIIAVVYGINDAAENYCGYCWSNFRLMQAPDEKQG